MRGITVLADGCTPPFFTASWGLCCQCLAQVSAKTQPCSFQPTARCENPQLSLTGGSPRKRSPHEMASCQGQDPSLCRPFLPWVRGHPPTRLEHQEDRSSRGPSVLKPGLRKVPQYQRPSVTGLGFQIGLFKVACGLGQGCVF